MLELAGLLKSGMPANQARALVAGQLAELSANQTRQLDAIWTLALRHGGSVSESIRSLGEALRASATHAREVELAFAAPKATAKLVSFLPPTGLLLAQLFGLDPLGAIMSNALALIALALGAILLILGRLWANSIIAKSAPREDDPGLIFEAVSSGVNSSLPFSTAVEDAISTFGGNLEISPTVNQKLDWLRDLNRNSGASLVDLLAASAAAERETRWFEESTAMAKLSVKLMIPLGLVTLPAFVLSTIVPIAISLLSNRQT